MLYEFIINIPYKTVEQTIDKLNAVGIYNLYYEPPIEIIKIQNGYGYKEREDEHVELKIYASDLEVDQLPDRYFELIKTTLSISKSSIHYICREEASWNQSVEFEDVDLGNDWILVYPNSIEQYTEKNILKFDPLAAFGTGLHETTQDCLRLILNKDLTGKKILDLGTGSGMLTIGASLIGARKIVAVDYEKVENEIYHNAQLNNLTNDIEVVQADLINGDYIISENYDLILINIGADETLSILKKHKLLKKSNEFIISGLVEWYIDPLVKELTNEGFSIEEKQQTNEWVSIHFSKST